ncbi:MAG: antitoxin MazE-like protein [Alphaproteobacteria bacterium]|nr:antitoxin MazE-like protein [Alphaproteobacteria bacterium]
MRSTKKAQTTREKVKNLARGVPNTRTAKFRVAAHCQSLAVALSAHAQGDQNFIDAVSDLGRA